MLEKEGADMRSKIAAIVLILMTAAEVIAQQDFRSLSPGIAPMMPRPRPELSSPADRIVKAKVLKIERDYSLIKDTNGSVMKVSKPSVSGLKIGALHDAAVRILDQRIIPFD